MATAMRSIRDGRMIEVTADGRNGQLIDKSRDGGGAEIIGESGALKRVLEQVETVAATDSTVLILGETGTGKELVARAIHNLSARRDRNFVSANCAAIPTGLLESELFGHERGAFTGAVTREIGRFEMADKGSMFLDEVGDMPLELQSKLLRVVQEQEFERLGTVRTIRVNFRLVAATNRDLLEMVETGRFRRDLPDYSSSTARPARGYSTSGTSFHENLCGTDE
jgi:formate hydrogenlyase transcriptional activator